MATTDNNIKYDSLFVNKFYNYAYPNGSPDHKNFYMETLKNGEIQISTFMENAIANTMGISRDSTVGRDLADGSEVKTAVSSYRNNSKQRGDWMHTYEVQNVKTKTGPIRFIGYNNIIKEFEFYFIPNWAYSHLSKRMSLPIEIFKNQSRPPIFTGIRTGRSKWHEFQVDTFETMCSIKGTITTVSNTTSLNQYSLF